MSVRVLHFADAHIDIANFGRHDSKSGLPYRVVDYLKSLDTIVDTAIEKRVDLVIFAGDAYKDRNPQPTFQRAWGERMMRLSRAGIPTLLLVGNHDVAPAENRAHTLQEYATLAVPHIHVADNVKLWGPEDLGVPVQVLALPWITRSRFLARHDMAGKTIEDVHEAILDRIQISIDHAIGKADPDLPFILTAHASILGASYGSERMVMLGQDLALGKGMVTNPHFDYVAMGHIHKHQSLHDQPPVVYPGSIERIDFGEWRDPKGFVLADVARGRTKWEFIRLDTRPFLDQMIRVEEADGFMDNIMRRLQPPEKLADAICRLRLEYPYELDGLLDERPIREHYAPAFALRLVKERIGSRQTKLGQLMAVESLGPYELLQAYWRSKDQSDTQVDELLRLAEEVLDIHPAKADGEAVSLPPLTEQ